MEKILLKHVSGSKAGQTETFELPLAGELMFGRDPSAQITYDAYKDDLVSRLHASLSQDPADAATFVVTDLNSRNGTYVNGMRITGPAKVKPGDVVQLGQNGPKVEFDMDPRPAAAAPATRLIQAPAAGMTREAPAMAQTSLSVPGPQAGPGPQSGSMPGGGSMGTGSQAGQGGGNTIGRATVERMITQTKSSSRNQTAIVAAAIVLLVALGGGAFYYFNHKEMKKIDTTVDTKMAEKNQQIEDLNKKLAENEQKLADAKSHTDAGLNIAEVNTPSTVFIRQSWKLIEMESGKQVFQQYSSWKHLRGQLKKTKQEMPELKDEGRPLPLYRIHSGLIEPQLTDDDANGVNVAIGSASTGSGFVVSPDGFILTNKHVAAPWECGYFEDTPPLPAIVAICNGEDCRDPVIKYMASREGNEKYLSMLKEWVPSKTKYIRDKSVDFKRLSGRIDRLEVMFAKSTQPTNASLVRFSSVADVALIKMDTTQSLSMCKLCESDCIKPGENVTVMGYPAVSPKVYAQQASVTPGKFGESVLENIPNPTVTRGNLQKIIQAQAETLAGPTVKYLSPQGDMYQLSINTTGAGNSGGPVFNDKGEVIALFTYGWYGAGVQVSMAVPIRYGLELMGNKQVIK